MIYFIGGPPRSGKTTLAKALAKEFRIPWISCDTLEVISGAYMSKKEWQKTHPYSELHIQNDIFYKKYSARQIVSVLKKQAQSTFSAIDMMTICEIKDGNDYIIEGYHIQPALAAKLAKKYGQKNIKAIFLGKFDAEKFAVDVHKSTTPNDWLILGTKKEETFVKVGEMVSLYSNFFEKEAIKYGYRFFNMDEKFEQKIKEATKYFK